jgi:hypothetical protein
MKYSFKLSIAFLPFLFCISIQAQQIKNHTVVKQKLPPKSVITNTNNLKNSYSDDLFPCPVGAPTNPNPANGATNIPITGVFLNWSNGSGTTQVELRFGEFGSMATVYSGSPITSWPLPGPLDYETTYQWKVIDKNDTCSTFGPTWSFTTMQDPYQLYDTIIVHPKNIQFWTGSSDSLIKTDGEVNTIYPNVGWMIFDLSSVPPLYYVTSIQFYGYVNSTNWPYWSATPMGNINPLIADAQDIYTQIMTNTAQGTA